MSSPRSTFLVRFGARAAALLSGPRRRRREAARAFPALASAVRADLGQAGDDLESLFLELSQQFVPLHGQVVDLLGGGEKLLALASGRQDGQTLFQDAVAGLQHPLDYIGRWSDCHDRLIDLVRRCEQHTAHMLAAQREMHDLLAPLTYIEVLFRIESATLDHEHRDTFLTVASEIARLRQLVDESFTANTEQLARTHAALGDVHRRLDVQFRVHGAQVAERRRQIDRALDQLDRQLTDNRNKDFPLQRVSRALAARIESIVAGIQRQDIVTQRCAHVAAALASPEAPGATPAHYLRLQERQLEEVERELDAAVATLDADIDQIEREAAEADRLCLALVDFKGMTAAADGMVELLLESLTGVHDVVRATLQLSETTLEATRPAGNLASNLSSALGELSVNMRLIALNAQVRSLQIGAGTGLEVLAARTAALSGDVAAMSGRVASELERLRAAADEMFSMLEEFVVQGREQAGRIDGTGGETTRRLHELRDRTLAVMTEVSGRATTVRSAAADARRTIARAPQAQAGIRTARERLAAFIAAHRLVASGPLSAAESEDLARHARMYTMESERRVHAAAFAAGAPPVAPATPSDAVELFTEPVAAEASTPAPASSPPPVRTVRPVARPDTPPPASANLGDNVDLF